MIYEVRTYTLRPGGAVAALEERFAKPGCTRISPRARVREASRQAGGAWPPQTGVRPIRQDNKLLVPAAFSPVW
jgi:hypothetical protein